MIQRRYRVDQTKPFAIEIYGPAPTNELVWKGQSENAFTIPARGERIQPMDVRGGHPDLFHEITGIEQVIWQSGNAVCSLTRVFTRPI